MKKLSKYLLILATFLLVSNFSLLAYATGEQVVVDAVSKQSTGTYTDGYTGKTGWAASGSAGYFLVGTNGKYLNSKSTGWAKWQPNLPEAGMYKVEIVSVKASSAFDVIINHNGSEAVQEIKEKGSKGVTEWTELGTYYFNADGTEYIMAKKDKTSSVFNLRIDGVRFTKEQAPEADAVLSDLVLNTGKGVLEPAFSPDITDYYINYPITEAVDETYSLKPVVLGEGATIKVNCNEVGNNTEITGLSTKDATKIEVSTKDKTRTYTIHTGYIMDTEGERYKESGKWGNSGLKTNYGKSLTRYAQGTADNVYAQYEPGQKGNFKVYFWKTTGGVGNASVGVLHIKHAGIVETRTINFTGGDIGWVELGNFNFNGTADEYIKLDATLSGTSPVRMDAIRLDSISDETMLNDTTITALEFGDNVKYYQEFLPAVNTSYDLYDVVKNKLILNIRTTNPEATITVNGEAFPSGQDKELLLNTGDNELQIKVTSKDGNHEKNYILTAKVNKIGIVSSDFVTNGNIIEGLVNGRINHSLTVYNNSATEESVSNVICLYDKETEKLIDVKLVTVNVLPAQEAILETGYITVENSENTIVKEFAFNDIKTMIPVKGFGILK